MAGKGKAKKKAKLEVLANVSNGAAKAIAAGEPYVARVTVMGTADILFHAWNNEAVAAKANAAKGSKAKKTDDIESYVYRTEDGELAIPGTYLRGAIVNAGRSFQDPRSKRKSAMDLFKAAIIPLTDLASLGVDDWDYIDRRRVLVMRSAITRERPALRKGWQATFDLEVALPEYVGPEFLLEVLNNAGRLVGLADFRPTFGRFQVVGYDVVLPDQAVAA